MYDCQHTYTVKAATINIFLVSGIVWRYSGSLKRFERSFRKKSVYDPTFRKEWPLFHSVH